MTELYNSVVLLQYSFNMTLSTQTHSVMCHTYIVQAVRVGGVNMEQILGFDKTKASDHIDLLASFPAEADTASCTFMANGAREELRHTA